MADLAWFNKDGLEKFFLEKYTEEGELKADAEPFGQGTFACVYHARSAGGSDDLVLRVVNARVGAAGDQCFAKEVLAVRAFLKLRGEGDVPEVGKVVMLDEAKQPPGLCPIYGYLIVNEEGSGVRKIFTVMPKAIPIMTVIEGQLQAAEAGGENATRDLSQLVKWMSQVACGMRFMHKKGVFWRDCKLDNIVLVNGDAKIIDISSGVCTVGYASHEQLVKLDLSAEAICNNQMITDALEQLLLDQPDHQTWETQDVFALSIVVVEFLTFGMFTYPYSGDKPTPSYAQLLLYELEVYNLLLQDLKGIYNVTSLTGRLDRKIKLWKDRIPPSDAIECTNQDVRDLSLWPLAVSEYSKDRRLFDLWAALAFWDHVDHQFGFIGHWTEWCFDFEKYAAGDAATATAPPPSSEAPSRKTGVDDGDEAKPEAPAVPMAVWRQRADELSADVGAIKARLLERNERMDNLEDDHTVRVVKRLSSLTQRMDVLNNSLSSFWGSNASPVKGAALPTVRIVYSTPDKVSQVVGARKENGFMQGGAAGAGAGTGAGGKLVEVRLRLKPKDANSRAQILEALGRAPGVGTPAKQ